jgi:hypothetical protein
MKKLPRVVLAKAGTKQLFLGIKLSSSGLGRDVRERERFCAGFTCADDRDFNLSARCTLFHA